jgi:predicted transposase/invertase (TIGR01784 family)
MPEEIYTIELPKVPANSDGSAAWDWMRFLKCKSKEDFDMIAERNADIRGAVKMLYRISEDPEVRARMEYREKARHDHATLLSAAIHDGETRGEAKSRMEIARNFKKMGIPAEQIARGTGLSVEEIAKL